METNENLSVECASSSKGLARTTKNMIFITTKTKKQIDF